jgi:hypothetical protein
MGSSAVSGFETLELLGRDDGRDCAPGDGDAHVLVDLEHHALGVQLDDLAVDATRGDDLVTGLER